MDHVLDSYRSSAGGRFEPVWTLEIQTLPEDIDAILDAVMAVHPLSHGDFDRNASISAALMETMQPSTDALNAIPSRGFGPGTTGTLVFCPRSWAPFSKCTARSAQ